MCVCVCVLRYDSVLCVCVNLDSQVDSTGSLSMSPYCLSMSLYVSQRTLCLPMYVGHYYSVCVCVCVCVCVLRGDRVNV